MSDAMQMSWSDEYWRGVTSHMVGDLEPVSSRSLYRFPFPTKCFLNSDYIVYEQYVSIELLTTTVKFKFYLTR